jgi:hypothetical protein
MDKNKSSSKIQKGSQDGSSFDREQFFEHSDDIEPMYDPIEGTISKIRRP